jgi:hypothetical protein
MCENNFEARARSEVLDILKENTVEKKVEVMG